MFRVGEASAPLYRHSGESRNPAILALWNANSYLASLDSGLRRNDGLRSEKLLKTEQLQKPEVSVAGLGPRAGRITATSLDCL